MFYCEPCFRNEYPYEEWIKWDEVHETWFATKSCDKCEIPEVCLNDEIIDPDEYIEQDDEEDCGCESCVTWRENNS